MITGTVKSPAVTSDAWCGEHQKSTIMSDICDFEWSNNRFRHNLTISDLKGYNKNEPTDRSRALIALKELIGASMDYALKDKSCFQDDEFLLRFLYARKFNVNDAFQLVINYHAYRQRNGPLLQRLSVLDENIQLALRDGFPGVLPNRDRRGRKVLIFLAGNWDYSSYSLVTVYRAMLLSLEKLLEDKQNQANGFIAIVDWTNFTFRQSSNLNPKVLKLMIEGLQDCFPVRFKAIHFIGQPWYVEAALAVIRPFLKEKTRERIKLHGGNLSTLHDCVARDILPTELGGEGPTFNPLNWYHELLESSQIATKPAPSYILSQPQYYTKSPAPPTTPLALTTTTTISTTTGSDFLKSTKAAAVKIGVLTTKANDPAANTLLGVGSDT
ncbi:clavesin-2 [Aedes aegypti]|uniref:CRAL-TRIO domain-containing protein n=2 Tax=Aedes aegypti TaxID=7159 RepID=A0A1S4FBC0_AEDAE|nr:clavesin-2 [Aedes aegypti]